MLRVGLLIALLFASARSVGSEPIFVGADRNTKPSDVAVVAASPVTEAKNGKSPMFVYDLREVSDPELQQAPIVLRTRPSAFSRAPFFILKPGRYTVRAFCTLSLRDAYAEMTFEAKGGDRVTLGCSGRTPNSVKLQLEPAES